MNPSVKISELTLGQLMEAIDEYLAGKAAPPRHIRGVKGLADYLGCSVRTAQRLKSSGKIDKALLQSQGVIVVDERRLNQLLKIKAC